MINYVMIRDEAGEKDSKIRDYWKYTKLDFTRKLPGDVVSEA
jgi:hypothetical protein